MSVETKKLSKEISEFFWREGFTLLLPKAVRPAMSQLS